MRITPVFATFLILSGFIACQSAYDASYKPYKNGVGWSDADVDAEHVVVTYSAPPGTPFTLMRRMALIRAAEIAKARKSNYFQPTHWEIVQVAGAKAIILDEKPATPLSLRVFTRKMNVPADSSLVQKDPPKHRIDYNLHILLNPKDISEALQTKTVLSEAAAYKK